MDIKSLKRVFKIGSLYLQDVLPQAPVEEAVKVYATNYPIVSSGYLEEPEIMDYEGEQVMCYSVSPAPAKTKG